MRNNFREEIREMMECKSLSMIHSNRKHIHQSIGYANRVQIQLSLASPSRNNRMAAVPQSMTESQSIQESRSPKRVTGAQNLPKALPEL
jgi:hypothetical protein